MTIVKFFTVAVLVLGGCLPALAQDKELDPVAEPGTTVQAKCVAEDDGYVMRGKTPTFVITLENKCEQRMSCKVFAFITSAKGMAQGRGTIVMAPKSKGAAAKSTWSMKAKMIGGSSQSTRECRTI